jgi:hypothetical protein
MIFPVGSGKMNNILPEFQKFVTERKLAPENQIPFYAHWASKFLQFSNSRQDKPLDLRILNWKIGTF